jgi:hypothetical protein
LAFFVVSHSALAGGGMTIGLVQLDVPNDETEDKRLAALIANDLLPQALEKGFTERYGIYPLVSSVPRGEAANLDALREKTAFSRCWWSRS